MRWGCSLHWKRKDLSSGPGSPRSVSLSSFIILDLTFLICKLGRGGIELEETNSIVKCLLLHPGVFPEAEAGAQVPDSQAVFLA